jgi:hypothetical protein
MVREDDAVRVGIEPLRLAGLAAIVDIWPENRSAMPRRQAE